MGKGDEPVGERDVAVPAAALPARSRSLATAQRAGHPVGFHAVALSQTKLKPNFASLHCLLPVRHNP